MQKTKILNKNYEKIKKIGNGSFGCVYLVKKLPTDVEENNENSKDNFFAIKKFYMDAVNFTFFTILAQK